MPSGWNVLEDTEKHGKRFVRIEDATNERIYENYFPSNTSVTAIKARFRAQVQEHRAEIAAKQVISLIDLSTFEASL